MPEVDYVSLSKAMSKALRHKPERLGIKLRKDGSVAISTLVRALNKRGGWPRELDESDVMHVVEHGSKQRFAVENGRIRARYGHSLELPISYVRSTPPNILYHGTTRSAAESILEEGLLPMGRQLVHLSTDVETALKVGARHGRPVVVLRVDAARAAHDGVPFYLGNDTTWLADRVDATYLEVMA